MDGDIVSSGLIGISDRIENFGIERMDDQLAANRGIGTSKGIENPSQAAVCGFIDAAAEKKIKSGRVQWVKGDVINRGIQGGNLFPCLGGVRRLEHLSRIGVCNGKKFILILRIIGEA
jgi:hypothetical protein